MIGEKALGYNAALMLEGALAPAEKRTIFGLGINFERSAAASLVVYECECGS